MSKVVVTRMPIEETEVTVCAVSENNRIAEIRFASEESKSLLGTIYVGQVENIVENIQAAFVLIAPGVRCYLPLSETRHLIWSHGKTDGQPLRPGDLVLVQVSREAMKTKLPSVSANLTLQGQYLVLTSGDKSIGISKKLPHDVRHRFTDWVETLEPQAGEEFGMIIRTNAGTASMEKIQEEYASLLEQFRRITVQGRSRSCFSVLYRPDPFWYRCIRDQRKDELTEVVTDLPECAEFLRTQGTMDLSLLRNYEDALLPLYKLYRLETAVEEICERRVWLKSGGFLVIEQTEAFVSIDVNTGKYTGRKKSEETFRKINLEAAAEIARQLRLRNLSGSILVDFINLENPDHREELFHVLQKIAKKDPVRTRAIDITKLNILEMTRQKIRRPVIEELREIRFKK